MDDSLLATQINYTAHKHHRELINLAIDRDLVSKLQNVPQPSYSYLAAYRSLCQKDIDSTFKNRSNSGYNQADNCANTRRKLFKNSGTQILNHQQSQCTNFAYYDDAKNQKCDSYVEKSIRRGTSFYDAQDNYQRHRQSQLTEMKKTLKNQIIQKQNQKTAKLRLQSEENESFQRQKRDRDQRYLQNLQQSRQRCKNLSDVLAKQIEDHQHCKDTKQQLVSDSPCKHNPITNPIEYRVENPYILHRMQSRQL